MKSKEIKQDKKTEGILLTPILTLSLVALSITGIIQVKKWKK